MLAPNTILQNRYRVMRELGHGGMGTVYEALDQRINCIVALKETSAGSDEEGRRAFEREAALLGNLRHSALPKVMDYFEEGDGDFLVMEFIPGYDLAELLELRGSPFPQVQVMRWANELLKVLEYLHGQQPPILHRDIKPSNLKLTKQGEIFLLDFGLAKGTAGQMATLMTSRSVRGYTPVYAALEQIHGEGTDPRSDLYSLGATFYHLLTGIPPIAAPRRFSLMEDGQPDPLPPIEKLNPQCSPGVTAVIHQAMAINRRQRPAGATEMRKALRLAGEEDERGAAEEEYRRAEEKRLQRDSGKAAFEKKAVPQSSLAGVAEAVDPNIPEGFRQTKKEGVKANERTLHDADEERIRAEKQPVSEPEVKITGTTKPALAYAASRLDDDKFFDDKPTVSRSFRRRIVLIAGAGLIGLLAVAGVIVIWSSRERTTDNQTLPDNQSVTSGQQVKLTEGQSKSPDAPLPPTGMVYVPGGKFTMGRDDGDVYERPAHEVTVKPFFIDTYEVTNADYANCIIAQQCTAPPGWSGPSPPPASAKRPVTGVRWSEANDYARFVGKRLPTEEEWEFAARGTDGRIYPWGKSWQRSLANADGARQEIADVGSFSGTSAFGAFDMVGNAWEWTASELRAYPRGRLPANVPSGDLKVIRGGSYESTKEFATATYRTGWPARGARTYNQTGFRCAKDIGP